MQRVRALAEALRMGVLYPRWFPDFSFGYGYPVLNFYAPASYYPPAILALIGWEPVTAVRITLAGVFALSGLGMWFLLRLWSGLLPALAGVVLFLVFPYRLYDLFIRGALPEFAAFMWLPLIAYFTCRAYKQPSHSSPFIFAALCWAGLVLTHNLTAMMTLLAGIVLLPVLAPFLKGSAHGLSGYAVSLATTSLTFGALTEGSAQGRSSYAVSLAQLGRVLLLPLGIGLLLSAWYWAPALLEAQWVGIGAGGSEAAYARHFVEWGSLFSWSSPYPYPDAASPTVRLPAFVLAVMALAVIVALLHRTRTTAVVLVAGLSLAILSIWLTTASSAFVWQIAEPVLGKLQFPWRWQVILAAALSVLLAVAWQQLMAGLNNSGDAEQTQQGRRPALLLLSAFLVVYLVLYSVLGLAAQPPNPANSSVTTVTAANMWSIDAQNGQVGASWTGEFLPSTVTEQRWAIGRAPADGSTAAALPPVSMKALPEQVGYTSATYRVTSTEPSLFILHQFFYPAWKVLVDGAVTAARPHGPLGLLAVDLSPGEHRLEVGWDATAAVWLGRILTAAGWLVLLWLVVQLQPVRWWAVAGLVVGAGFMLLAASGLTAQVTQPTPIGADYQIVRLEAMDTQPAAPGTDAHVRLYWSINGPVEPLIAFVHVVNQNGEVVAQHDGPLGGEHTPVERWLPGMMLDNTHVIALPPELPPGTYTLKVGVYPPGQPDKPLPAAGATSPRVDAGFLEVRP